MLFASDFGQIIPGWVYAILIIAGVVFVVAGFLGLICFVLSIVRSKTDPRDDRPGRDGDGV
jgi:hypothetical protein